MSEGDVSLFDDECEDLIGSLIEEYGTGGSMIQRARRRTVASNNNNNNNNNNNHATAAIEILPVSASRPVGPATVPHTFIPSSHRSSRIRSHSNANRLELAVVVLIVVVLVQFSIIYHSGGESRTENAQEEHDRLYYYGQGGTLQIIDPYEPSVDRPVRSSTLLKNKSLQKWVHAVQKETEPTKQPENGEARSKNIAAKRTHEKDAVQIKIVVSETKHSSNISQEEAPSVWNTSNSTTIHPTNTTTIPTRTTDYTSHNTSREETRPVEWNASSTMLNRNNATTVPSLGNQHGVNETTYLHKKESTNHAPIENTSQTNISQAAATNITMVPTRTPQPYNNITHTYNNTNHSEIIAVVSTIPNSNEDEPPATAPTVATTMNTTTKIGIITQIANHTNPRNATLDLQVQQPMANITQGYHGIPRNNNDNATATANISIATNTSRTTILQPTSALHPYHANANATSKSTLFPSNVNISSTVVTSKAVP